MDTSTSPPRRRFSAEERFRLVEQYGQGDLTQVQFAERHGIKLHTLRLWLYKTRRKKRSRTKFQEIPAVSFLGPRWAAEIELKNGTTLRLGAEAKREFFSVLIDTLRDTSC